MKEKIIELAAYLSAFTIGAVCLGYAYNTVAHEFNLPEFNYLTFILGVWGIRIALYKKVRDA